MDSILNQTFGEIEVIICDDASTDSTREILESYTDHRLQLILNEENKGLTYNLNHMLPLCRGKYIARMDADDIALPNRLEEQYLFMEAHSDIGICGTAIEAFHQGEEKTQVVRFPQDDLSIRAFAFVQSPFTHPTVMMRKRVLERHQLQYPPQYSKGQDYGLWIEMLKYTRGANLQDVLLRFRRHEENVSNWADGGKLEEKIKLVSSLHKSYIAEYGISLTDEEAAVYSRFVDRSIPSELSPLRQKQVTAILKRIQTQLAKRYPAIVPLWKRPLSMNIFYNFSSSRKLPQTFYLWRLFIKGWNVYLKRMIKR